MSDQPVALGGALSSFAVVEVLLMVIQATTLALVDIDTGSGFNMARTFMAALWAAQVFVKDHGRAPTAEERRRLAWLTLALHWAISLVLPALVAGFVPEVVDLYLRALQKMSFITLVVAIVFSGIYLGLYHLAYGSLARRYEKKLAIKRSQAG